MVSSNCIKYLTKLSLKIYFEIVIDSEGASLREDIDQIVGGEEAKAGAYPYQVPFYSAGCHVANFSTFDFHSFRQLFSHADVSFVAVL